MEEIDLTTSICQIDGVLQYVDTINREVGVVVNRIRVHVAVPPTCAVVLNGERVKLRLLQPTDRVRVFYEAEQAGLLTAQRLEAEGGSAVPLGP